MGSELWLVAVGVALGAVGGYVLAGIRHATHRPEPPRGVAPHLLPDPALAWLRRATGAAGVWTVEGAEGSGRLMHHALDPASPPPEAVSEMVERRLEALSRAPAGGTVERLSGGTLVAEAGNGAAVGVLLTGDAPLAVIEDARYSLAELLEGLRQVPVLREVTRSPGEQTGESVGSVGLRLAAQLERITGGPAVVAARSGDVVRIIGTSPQADPRLRDRDAPSGSWLAQTALGADAPRDGVDEDPLDDIVPDRRRRAGSWYVRTISSEGQPVGAAALLLPPEQEFSGALAAEVQGALANAGPRLLEAAALERSRHASVTDPLTGLANRRGLEQALFGLGDPAGVYISADLDKFKHLNDTLGHEAGDAALVHFAGILRAQLRGSDLAARVGGEEFAIWLPGQTLEEGVRVAERIRHALGSSRVQWQGHQRPISASFGVAACPETSRHRENLAHQADSAMYKAKELGRNRVEAAPRAPARPGGVHTRPAPLEP
jgi:diguanylate cyclase (GGDEF)-like protein